MGLFDKIASAFEKKNCDICGGEIGLLGNRKLEDGNCCKNCAKLLSPWFDDRRHSTVESIKAQLQYREENKALVSSFQVTRSFGDGYMTLMIDDNQGKFCVAERKDLTSGNPDIVDISQITSAYLDPKEHKTELTYKNQEGNTVRYNPPRYEYSYDFHYVIQVNHPYFSEMDFNLNRTTVVLQENKTAPTMNQGVLGSVLSALSSTGQAYNPEYERYMSLGNTLTDLLMNTARRTAGTQSVAGTQANAASAGNDQAVEQAARQVLDQVAALKEQAAQNAAAAEWVCEYCGTKNTGNFCTGCGSQK